MYKGPVSQSKTNTAALLHNISMNLNLYEIQFSSLTLLNTYIHENFDQPPTVKEVRKNLYFEIKFALLTDFSTESRPPSSLNLNLLLLPSEASKEPNKMHKTIANCILSQTKSKYRYSEPAMR